MGHTPDSEANAVSPHTVDSGPAVARFLIRLAVWGAFVLFAAGQWHWAVTMSPPDSQAALDVMHVLLTRKILEVACAFGIALAFDLLVRR